MPACNQVPAEQPAPLPSAYAAICRTLAPRQMCMSDGWQIPGHSLINRRASLEGYARGCSDIRAFDKIALRPVDNLTIMVDSAAATGNKLNAANREYFRNLAVYLPILGLHTLAGPHRIAAVYGLALHIAQHNPALNF